MTTPIQVPRLNANEDQVLIVKLHVADGAQVAEGALLLEVETTKATSEVLAPVTGTVSGLKVAEGQFVEVGRTLGWLTDAAAPAAAPAAAAAADAAPQVSAKARKLAARYGIDLAAVAGQDGRVTAADVERHHAIAAVPDLAVPSRRKAVVFGGSGHAAVILEALLGQGYEIVGCVDDDPTMQGAEVLGGVRVIGTRALLPQLVEDGVGIAFIGVGGATSSAMREEIFATLSAAGLGLPPVVHRRAYVSAGATLGAATVVLPGAVVGPRCRIGANVIVNQGAQICHDSIVDSGCHITPGAVIAGGCRIGAGSVVGMTAAVLLAATIGRGCLIHNGAAVNSDVPDHTEVRADGTRARRSGA